MAHWLPASLQGPHGLLPCGWRGQLGMAFVQPILSPSIAHQQTQHQPCFMASLTPGSSCGRGRKGGPFSFSGELSQTAGERNVLKESQASKLPHQSVLAPVLSLWLAPVLWGCLESRRCHSRMHGTGQGGRAGGELGERRRRGKKNSVSGGGPLGACEARLSFTPRWLNSFARLLLPPGDIS